MKGRGIISENEFLIAKTGERPSEKEFRKKLRQIRKKREDFKKKEIASCHVCGKSVVDKNGRFELGTHQVGSDDGQSIWSYHKECYEKYQNHFCKGEEIWMSICRECQEEEEKIIEELNECVEDSQSAPEVKE